MSLPGDHETLFATADLEVTRCPYPIYAHLRQDHPVQWIEPLAAFAVTRHADVLDALLRTDELSSAKQSGPGAASSLAQQVVDDPRYPDHVRSAAARRLTIAPGAPVLVNADPPRHREQRLMLNKTFTPRRVAALEPSIRALAEVLVGNLLAAGGGDAVSAFAAPLPMTVIATALGCADVDGAVLRRWSDAFVRANGRPTLAYEHVVELFTAMDEAYDFFGDRLAERRSRPLDDLISDVATAALSHHEQLQAVALLLTGGNETTTSLIASCVLTLAEDPSLQALLRDDFSLVPAFVEEVLRLEPPVQGLFRVATRDTEVGGTSIPAGSFLWLVYAACNRDEQVFPEPDVLKLDREEAREHLSFAQGPHFCMGSGLARAEARIAVETLLQATASVTLAPQERLSAWNPNLVQHGLTRLLVTATPA